MRTVLAIFCFLTVFPVALAAQDSPRTLSVAGRASIDAMPDMATITLGVTQQARHAKDALAATSAAVTQVLARLDAAGIAARDVQTSNISLHPVYGSRSMSSGTSDKITGFFASNTLMVRVRDLDILGDVLDAVAAEGANEFNGLSFGLQDPGPLRDQARVAAVKDAMARAALLAGAAGIELGPLLSFSQSGGQMPMPMMEAAMARSGPVPVAAGEVAISAEVQMVYQIAD